MGVTTGKSTTHGNLAALPRPLARVLPSLGAVFVSLIVPILCVPGMVLHPGHPTLPPGPVQPNSVTWAYYCTGGPIQKQSTVVSAVTRGRICWKTSEKKAVRLHHKKSQIFDMFIQ